MQKHFYKIFFCFLLLSSCFSFAQINLVFNPSFEVADTCPTATDQMSRCKGWSSYSQSPDYFNTCGSPGMAPPNCGFGYQWPHSGNAYAGKLTFLGTNSNYREIIGSALTTTLIIGKKYFISFFINFAGKSYKTATDKMGIRFSTVPFSKLTPAPINNFAHYYSTSIITDTTNWVQLKGSFIADSAYKYIGLGNFFNDVNTNTVSIGFGNNGSYYYIDDVCVTTDSLYNETWSDIKENQNKSENTKVFPNPTHNILSFEFVDYFPKRIVLFDNIGRLVFEKIIADNDKHLTIDVTSIPNGLYNACIEYSNGIENKKIIIINP